MFKDIVEKSLNDYYLDNYYDLTSKFVLIKCEKNVVDGINIELDNDNLESLDIHFATITRDYLITDKKTLKIREVATLICFLNEDDKIFTYLLSDSKGNMYSYSDRTNNILKTREIIINMINNIIVKELNEWE